MTVVVLLSTFRGAAYVEAQLESLRTQSHRDLRVLWRDDGSDDGTVETVRAYAAAHPDLALDACPEAAGVNLGYRRSFWTLLRAAPDADAYAFCDQDDVWLPDKIASTLARLRALPGFRDAPCLCTSAFVYASEDLSVRRPAPYRKPAVPLRDLLFYTPAFGFTMLFNAPLRRMALDSLHGRDLPHDRWCAFLAAAFGSLVRDPAVGALYRRHDASVTSAGRGFAVGVRDWFRREILGDGFREFADFAAEFRATFGETLPPDARRLLDRFLPAEAPFPTRLRRALSPGRFRPTAAGEIALRLSLLRRVRPRPAAPAAEVRP